MSLDRNAGYKLGKPKEAISIERFNHFLDTKITTAHTSITDKNTQWQHGDIRLGNGKYIEVKGQGINPTKFGGYNFIELGEATNNPIHAAGFDNLKNILGIPNLESMVIRDKNNNMDAPFGSPAMFNVGLTPASNNSVYAYVNNKREDSNEFYIYLYSAKTLLSMVSGAILSGASKISLGAGGANSVTYGITIPVAKAVWQRINNEWVFVGSGNEKAIIAAIA
jgi:hypothetical protein